MKLFPIMAEYGGHAKTSTIDYIPYDVIASHEEQALKNHGQTLKRLSERGGLSYDEALAVLEDREYSRMEQRIAKSKVFAIVIEYKQQNRGEANEKKIDKDIDPAYFFDIPHENIKGIHIVNLYMDSDKARFLVKRDGTVRYLGRTGYIKKSFKFKKIGERKITYENRKPKA